MKIKCIGGMADGRIIDVDDYMIDGDAVRVLAKIEMEVTEYIKKGTIPTEQLTIPYYYYKISSLHKIENGFKHTIKFLYPADKWSEWDALVFLFRSHHG